MEFVGYTLGIVALLVPLVAFAAGLWWMGVGRRRYSVRSWEGVFFIGCLLLTSLLAGSFIVPHLSQLIVLGAVVIAAGLFGMSVRRVAPVKGQVWRPVQATLLVSAGALVLSLANGFGGSSIGAMFGPHQVRLDGEFCLLNAERGGIDFWLRASLVYLTVVIVDMAFRERAAACIAALVFFLAAGGSAVAVAKVDSCGYEDASRNTAAESGKKGRLIWLPVARAGRLM